jgi:hypothetical protein
MMCFITTPCDKFVRTVKQIMLEPNVLFLHDISCFGCASFYYYDNLQFLPCAFCSLFAVQKSCNFCLSLYSHLVIFMLQRSEYASCRVINHYSPRVRSRQRQKEETKEGKFVQGGAANFITEFCKAAVTL